MDADTIDKEINACFSEDSSIYKKTIKQIALFFYLQGDMRNVSLRNALRSKLEHYRKALGSLDFEALKSADKVWEENDKNAD